MEKLIQLVSEKTGIDAGQAKTAVTTVLNFLKDKVPAPIASQIDNVVSSESTEAGEGSSSVSDIANKLGGMFRG